MGKSESKALIEAYAKQAGKPPEEVAAEIAKTYGYQKPDVPIPTTSDEKISPIMAAILEAKKAELELQKAGVGAGEVSPTIKMVMEMLIMMPLMNKLSGQGQDSSMPKQQDPMELLAKNDEKWERRLAMEKAEREKETMQRQLDEIKTLIQNSSGSKKEELTEKFDKLTERLDAEKERRHEEALATKSAEISQLREDMQGYFEELRNQPPAKDASEGFFELMQKMEKFDNIVRNRGKALGMTDEQIEKEVAEATPMKQQIIKDVFKTVNRYIDAVAGKKSEPETTTEEPQVAQTVCRNCGNLSDNGTEYCNPCRQAYVEQQKAHAEADAKARQAGEIPAEKEEPVTVEVEEKPEPAINPT